MKILSNKELADIFFEISPGSKKGYETIKNCSSNIFLLINKNLEKAEDGTRILKECRIQKQAEEILIVIVRSGKEVAKIMYEKSKKRVNIRGGDKLDLDKQEDFENHWKQWY